MGGNDPRIDVMLKTLRDLHKTLRELNALVNQMDQAAVAALNMEGH